MNRTILTVTLCFFGLILAAVSYGTAAQAAGLEDLTRGSGTPFQNVEALYKKAIGMQMNDFPVATDTSIKNWQCYGLRPDTTAAQLSPLGSVPGRVQALRSTSAATNGALYTTADNGTSAKPQLVDIIEMVPTDGSFAQTPEQAGLIADRFGLTVSTEPPGMPDSASSGAPGIVETFFNIPGNITTVIQVTYRMSSGAIVVNQEGETITPTSNTFMYYYCFQK